MLAASAAFRVSPNSTIAADVVGAMLVRWHYIALLAPLVLFALELRRARPVVLTILFAALLLAAAQGMVDLRLRAMRNAGVNINALDRNHPVRRQFGRMHGVSMVLLLLQTVFAAAVVGAGEKKREDAMTESGDREDTTIYIVVENDQGQYSIWPQGRELPLGWRDVGFHGLKEECLRYIEEIWTDMRRPAISEAPENNGGNGTDTSGGGP